MNARRTWAVARKEVLHIVRDVRSLALALALPALLLLLFGYALTLDVDRIPTIVYDADQSPLSRRLIARFEGSRYFQIIDVADKYAIIDRGINRDRCQLGVVIPRDYSRKLQAGREADIQLLFDGSNSNTASIALGYATALLQAYTAEIISEAQNLKGGGTYRAPLEGRLRVWYNSELKSKNYIVPGLIAVIIMIIASLLTSLTIAREWEMGTMEQLLSTPVRAQEIVLGKMSAFFALGIIDMLIALAAGVGIFKVPLRGSVLFLFVGSCIFLVGALCWGILLSALTRSQLLAYQLGMLTSFLPAFILSGFIFAIENMPAVIQIITYIFPARYFIIILKGVFLRGVGLEVLWAEVALLLVYASVVFFVATRRLRQKIA
jgi:ABC-2 type transport system permease protein